MHKILSKTAVTRAEADSIMCSIHQELIPTIKTLILTCVTYLDSAFSFGWGAKRSAWEDKCAAETNVTCRFLHDKVQTVAQ